MRVIMSQRRVDCAADNQMSGFTAPLARSNGRALVIASLPSRSTLMDQLTHLGYQCEEAEDPYTAMADLCSRPLAYRAIVLSLNGLYREELAFIATVKRRYAHIDVWLSDTDGRAAALAEAMQQGADGLVSDEGLHRFTQRPPAATSPPAASRPAPAAPAPLQLPRSEQDGGEPPTGEPVLTAEELRALLQEHPPRPTGSDDI